MNIASDIKTYTASRARDNLYSLIKAAGTGLKAFEIILRGYEPVVLINKAELDAWRETLDILSNKKEIAAIRRAKRQKKTIPHEEMLRQIGINK